MDKQRENRCVVGTELRVVVGDPVATLELLGHSIVYVERTYLTIIRLLSRCLTLKTSAYPKQLEMRQASAVWEDLCHILSRPHKTVRSGVSEGPACACQPRAPAIAAKLTHHIRTVRNLLAVTAPLLSSNTQQGTAQY